MFSQRDAFGTLFDLTQKHRRRRGLPVGGGNYYTHNAHRCLRTRHRNSASDPPVVSTGEEI